MFYVYALPNRLTVIFDLTVAVEVGLVLACLFFIYRVSSLTNIEPVQPEALPYSVRMVPGVVAYRLFGSLFFGSVGKLEALLEFEGDAALCKVMVLDLHHVINVDTTGLDTLEVLRKSLARRGGLLLLCDLNSQPRSLMTRVGYFRTLGMDNVLPDLATALRRAAAIIDLGTPQRAFFHD